MQQITIAIVGAGNMAEQHCRAFRAVPEVKLVGITSRTKSKSENIANKYGIKNVFSNIAEMYQYTNADLVVIAVKELGVLDAVVDAAAFDWCMFLEKPAGYNLKIATEIRSIIVENGRRAFVGFNRRNYSSTLEARAMLEHLDGPRYISVQDQQSMSAARKIGHPEEVVRYFMYANSIHTVDYLRMFARGRVEQVNRERKWAGEKTFVHTASIYFSSGDIGRYEAIWQGPGPWACTITTPTKRLEMRPLEQLWVQDLNERKSVAVKMDPVDTDYKAGLLRQSQELIKAIRGDRSANIVSIDESLEVMELVHRIYGV